MSACKNSKNVKSVEIKVIKCVVTGDYCAGKVRYLFKSFDGCDRTCWGRCRALIAKIVS